MELFKHKKLYDFKELETEYRKGKRFYLTPDGQTYPSITNVLGWFKIKAIKEWRQRVGEEEAKKVTAQSSRRGTAVHKICEDYLQNNPDYTMKHMPSNLQMFKTIKQILDDNIKCVYHQEVPLYNPKLRIAGRVDCVCNWNGKDSIVDFKTSRKFKKKEWITDYFEQAAAYSLMFEHVTGIHLKNIVIVMAIENDNPVVYEESIYEHIPNLIKKIETFHEYYDNKNLDKTIEASIDNAGSIA